MFEEKDNRFFFSFIDFCDVYMFIRWRITFGDVLPYASLTLRALDPSKSRREFAKNKLFCLRPFSAYG